VEGFRAVGRDGSAGASTTALPEVVALVRLLDVAAKRAGRRTHAPAGRFRGVAAACFGSVNALVAEVSVNKGRLIVKTRDA
jgi:hypothetical protein